MSNPQTLPECFNELEKWRERLRQTVTPESLVREIEDRLQRESDPRRLRILTVFLVEAHKAQGNEAAVAAIREKDRVFQIHRWHSELHLADPHKDLVQELKDRIAGEKDQQCLRALRLLLAFEYTAHGHFASAETVCLDVFEEDPHEPMPLINLASQKFFMEKRPEEAMRIISRAVEVSLRAGIYRRLALGHQARIALHLHDYPLVENVLRTLLQLTFTRGNADIGVERDFLDHLPPDSIDPEVARQYDEYCRQRGKQPGADSPKQTGPAEH
jgi:hypothetical protein